MSLDTQTLVTAVGGTAAGAVSIGWFARLMFQRMIKQNDALHREHDRKFEKLIDRFGDAVQALQVKLAALEVAVSEAKNMREDIRSLWGRSEVTHEKVLKAHSRVDQLKEGISQIKSDIERINSSL